MGFQEFGEVLRQLRTEKSLSIDDVARRIKIPAKTLQDFESGEQHCTLHPVYCRGFAKAYAEFLGMDRAALESALNALYPPEDEEYDSPILIVARRKEGPGRGWLAAFIIVVMFLAGAWYVYANGLPTLSWLSSLSDIVKQNGAPTANATAVAPKAENTPPPQPDFTQETVTGTPLNQLNATFPGINAEAPRSMASITPESSLTPPVQANSTAIGLSDTPGPHRLVIVTGSSDCWTESRVDKEEKRSVYLKSGQTHILTFQNSLNLRLGNIAGVKLRLDGQLYEIPAGHGNARTLVFGEAAANSNSPTP